MGLSDKSKDRGLRAILEGPLTLGLLSQGVLMPDRRPVAFAGEEMGVWRNASEVRFSPLSEDTEITGWQVLDRNGDEVAIYDEVEGFAPKLIERGEEPIARAGELVIKLEG